MKKKPPVYRMLRHFRGEVSVTVAGRYTVAKNLEIGVARCSDTDVFTKKLGRTIALGRAQKCPLRTIPTVCEDQAENIFHKIAPFIASHVRSTKQVKC